jgi:hypothetical protein
MLRDVESVLSKKKIPAYVEPSAYRYVYTCIHIFHSLSLKIVFLLIDVRKDENDSKEKRFVTKRTWEG